MSYFVNLYFIWTGGWNASFILLFSINPKILPLVMPTLFYLGCITKSKNLSPGVLKPFTQLLKVLHTQTWSFVSSSCTTSIYSKFFSSFWFLCLITSPLTRLPGPKSHRNYYWCFHVQLFWSHCCHITTPTLSVILHYHQMVPSYYNMMDLLYGIPMGIEKAHDSCSQTHDNLLRVFLIITCLVHSIYFPPEIIIGQVLSCDTETLAHGC